MSSKRSFLDLLMVGEVSLDQIDDFVDRWHEAPDGRELQDYLGMKPEEYSLWLRVPDALQYVVAARRETKPLAETVMRACNELRQTAPGDDEGTMARLEQWLSIKGVVT